MIDEGNITGTQFIIIALVSIVVIAIIWHRMEDWDIPEPKPTQTPLPPYIERYGAYIQARGKYYN